MVLLYNEMYSGKSLETVASIQTSIKWTIAHLLHLELLVSVLHVFISWQATACMFICAVFTFCNLISSKLLAFPVNKIWYHKKRLTLLHQQCFCMYIQAWYFVLEGARRFFLGKGHLYEEFVNFYWDFWKGTKAKTRGNGGNCLRCLR